MSTRKDSVELGELMIASLGVRSPAIRAAGHLDCQGDHFMHAKAHIEAGAFAIILLGPSRLTRPAKDASPCYQQEEINTIWQCCEHAAREGRPFRAFPIILQNLSGSPEPGDYYQALAADFEQAEGVASWLAKQSTETLRSHTDSSSQEFQEDLKRIISKIVVHMSPVFARRKAEPHRESVASKSFELVSDADGHQRQASRSDSPPPLVDTRSIFDALERAYLRRAVKGWSAGVIGDVVGRGSGDSAFRFEPSRFVEFTATQHHRDGSRDHSVERFPLSHWLFRPQEFPLLMIGDGGAGKTTALTAAACAFAAQWDATSKTFCKEIAEGQWMNTALNEFKQNKTKQYVPVVIRCVDALEAMGTRLGDSDALLDVVLMHMRRVSRAEDSDARIAQPEHEAFYGHVSRQPYVLMLDGLDELSDAGRAETLFRAAYNLARELSDSVFRVIFTTRPDHGLRSRATQINLDAPLYSWEHIEMFISRFTDDPGAQRRLASAARKLWDSGDGRNAPLRTPLLLNAFCHIALEDDDPAVTESQFCGRVIDYSLRGRVFRVLAGACESTDGDVEGAARKILRVFALAFVMNPGKGKIRLDEDDAIGWLRREHHKLGLKALDAAKAKALLRELATQTSLFRLDGASYTFANTAMFWEYLAGEEMATGDMARQFTSGSRLGSASWRAAIGFAHAIRIDSPGANEEFTLEIPDALLGVALSASEADQAWIAGRAALDVLAGRPPPDAFDWTLTAPMSNTAERAMQVYRRWRDSWSAGKRATFSDAFFRIGRRESGERTSAAVSQLLDIFLAPRKPWISVEAKGVPIGLQIADAPVLVADYRRFLEDERRLDDAFWHHAPSTSAEGGARTLVSDLDDGSTVSIKRLNQWVAQMERPGSPVVSVTWREAVAYCHWLTARLHEIPGALGEDEVVRLPTEGEWAALLLWASDGKSYPWGSASLDHDPERINWLRADVDHPSAPGVFVSTGVEGLYDLGSNVSCWAVPSDALSVWPPQLVRDAVTCGGSWLEFRPGAFKVKAKPYSAAPGSREAGLGFRLVRAPKLK